MIIAGIILFYLAAANAVLALAVGTCTQGDAGQLWGGVLSLALHAVAALFLTQSKRPALTAILLLPTTPLLAWQAIFTIRLTTGHWFANASACDILDNTSGQAPDGAEPWFILIWLLLSTASFWSFGTIILRARPIPNRV